MRKIKHIIYLFAAAALLVACSESLEDTYRDYAGDGKIRYVAKCTELQVTPKWERLLVEWINSKDATVNKIKIIWTLEDQKDSVLLPRAAMSYELENLVDGTYRFDICAVDSAGNESLKETTYGRPYTRDHEIMRAFTRGIIKSYFVNDYLIFFSDQWNEYIVEMKLKYKDTGGNTQYYVFDEKTSYNKLITIPNVSMDTVYMLRKGRLVDCPDVIEFDPIVISRKKSFTAGFVHAIERNFGLTTDTKEQEEKFEAFVEGVTELEFDYDIESFEDILHCPNLKKLIFGKKRYLNPKYPTRDDKSQLLSPEEKSLLVLDKANEILGMTIERYGNNGMFMKHYFEKNLSYSTYMNYSPLPTLELLEKEALRVYEDGSQIACSPTDPYAMLSHLQDDDPSTTWETSSYTSVRDYELQMELLVPTEIRGVKIAQPLYNPRADLKTLYYMPRAITVQTSLDGAYWQNVTFFEFNDLGRGSGEVTLLPIAEGSRLVKYIRIFLRDGVDDGSICAIKLGDILLYK